MCCVNMVSRISASCPASGWNSPNITPMVRNGANRCTRSGIPPIVSLCQLYWRNNTEMGVSMPASCHQINIVWHALIVGWLDPQSTSWESLTAVHGCYSQSKVSFEHFKTRDFIGNKIKACCRNEYRCNQSVAEGKEGHRATRKIIKAPPILHMIKQFTAHKKYTRTFKTQLCKGMSLRT